MFMDHYPLDIYEPTTRAKSEGRDKAANDQMSFSVSYNKCCHSNSGEY